MLATLQKTARMHDERSGSGKLTGFLDSDRLACQPWFKHHAASTYLAMRTTGPSVAGAGQEHRG